MANADRLVELFNGAKIRPTGVVRDAYLAEECGEDAALKEQVCSLVAAHECAGEFLRARPELAPEIGAQLTRLKPEEAGQQIGPYKLREPIGEGGHGVVWVAEQLQPVRRTVALKIIKLGMDTRDVVARFEQERQALAMMDHPNIARVLDAGATEHGRPFFVMELVRGLKITDYCDQANLPTAERLILFIQVCHAVQHAHQKGIIHRDLKPSNILVTQLDGVAVPKVIDFGVAKATQGRLGDFSIYTQFQQLIGTPLYMSPEQAEMNGIDVDTRTDIYALGVLLYELLTGRTPFNAEVFLKAGYDEMRRLIREQEPQKPSTALHTMLPSQVITVAQHRASEPPKLIHAIRGDLDWIVMKTLEKDRARRYDTANGLAMDIQRHLNNEPVIARPPSRGYRLQKLVRRNKLAFAAGTAIAASLVIGFTTATWMYLLESDARKRATQAEKLATERLMEVSAERDAKEVARTEAEAISTFMTETFQSPDPARDGRTITVAETLDRAAKKLETELVGQPARRAKLQTTLGDTYRALGLYRQAVPLMEKARDYHLTVFGPEHPDTLAAMDGLARSYYAAGRYDEALKLREQLLPLCRAVLGPEHIQTIRAMLGLANSYPEAQIKQREEVLTLCRTVLGPEHPDTLGAMLSLANSYNNIGPQDEGRKLREEMLALSRKVFGPEHPRTLQAMHNLTFSYADTGRRDEALKLREEVLALDRKVLGPEHPSTLYTMSFLANSYDDAGRQDEALQLREEVLAQRRKALGPEHPDTLGAMGILAASYAIAERWDEAIGLRKEELEICRKIPAQKQTGLADALNFLGTALLGQGKHVEAEAAFSESLALRRKLPADEPQLAATLAEFTRSLLIRQKFIEAEPLARECLAIREKKLPDDWRTFNARSMLGGSLLGQKKYAEAEPLLLSGYEGMKQREDKISAIGKPRVKETLRRLVQLYEAMGQTEKATEWKTKLAGFEQAEAEKKTAIPKP